MKHKQDVIAYVKASAVVCELLYWRLKLEKVGIESIRPRLILTKEMRVPEEKHDVRLIKIGWMASFWSDFQTFGFLTIAFIANYHLAGGSGWLGAFLFILGSVAVVGRVAASKHVHEFKTVDEAIDFLTIEKETRI